ncbi:hypothetical protein ACQCQG_25625, partial [Ralstonia pseudosolanacearum]|uniref:hypothetical protein n=1 Tax=Ralstonia pseudosolanacearum TaxID=1310165 RepID=UPI003CE855E5
KQESQRPGLQPCTPGRFAFCAAKKGPYPGRAVRAGVATAQGEWIDLQALPKPAEAARDDAQGALF